jgi:hypothetical protein
VVEDIPEDEADYIPGVDDGEWWTVRYCKVDFLDYPIDKWR